MTLLYRQSRSGAALIMHEDLESAWYMLGMLGGGTVVPLFVLFATDEHKYEEE